MQSHSCVNLLYTKITVKNIAVNYAICVSPTIPSLRYNAQACTTWLRIMWPRRVQVATEFFRTSFEGKNY